jgi:hypothetical protein
MALDLNKPYQDQHGHWACPRCGKASGAFKSRLSVLGHFKGCKIGEPMVPKAAALPDPDEDLRATVKALVKRVDEQHAVQTNHFEHMGQQLASAASSPPSSRSGVLPWVLGIGGALAFFYFMDKKEREQQQAATRLGSLPKRGRDAAHDEMCRTLEDNGLDVPDSCREPTYEPPARASVRDSTSGLLNAVAVSGGVAAVIANGAKIAKSVGLFGNKTK